MSSTDLAALEAELTAGIAEATSLDELDKVRVAALGKKGRSPS